VYTVESTSSLGRARRAIGAGRLRERVGTTVLLLGTCSLLTDISSEMVAAILPIYLVATLGFSPLQYGVVDGLYQGASALVRLAAGFAGDRLRRHKLVASTGYALSAVCKLGLALVGSAWGGLSAVILLDRTGKGIRTAPRDAMISLTAPRTELGLAFGVHRALDTTGAMIGPLLAFALLAAAPGAYSSLFLISFCIALAGVGVIVLLVREPRHREEPAVAKPDLRAAAGLLADPAFRGLTIAGSVLGLATASDGFIYLTLLDRVDFDARLFPLLATGTALLYMALAAPLGRLADRVGRARVFFGGYAVLLSVYLLLLAPSIGAASLVAVLALMGVYYAATDGVLMAMGSVHVPEAMRGSGLALLGTATSIARLVASLAFGGLWTWLGLQTALTVFAGGLVAAMLVGVRTVRAARV
jgi:MFS family permease